MIYAVTCATCGLLIASGFGQACWDSPHGLCPTRGVVVRWEWIEWLKRREADGVTEAGRGMVEVKR